MESNGQTPGDGIVHSLSHTPCGDQTGRMGARNGVTSNFGPGSLGGLPKTEVTIATLLKKTGAYVTCAIGCAAAFPSCMRSILAEIYLCHACSCHDILRIKPRGRKWHLGVKPGFHPLDRGYDRYLGLPESNDYGCTDSGMGAPDSGCLHWREDRCPRNSHEHNPLWDGKTCHPGPLNPWNYSLPLLEDRQVVQQPADLEGTASAAAIPLSYRYAQFASDFVANTSSAAARQKFFVYLAFSHMHVPLVHGRAFAGKSGKGPLGDSLLELDHAAGMVLASLRTHQVENDTIIFLTGDNGPPEDQCDWGGSKGPFVGLSAKTTAGGGGSAGKLTSWEGGHREVGVVSWPGHIAAGDILMSLLAWVTDIYIPFH
eukprot:COSAG01_NODE_2685_length_7253_cov_6.363153_7_plen_371_part_00